MSTEKEKLACGDSQFCDECESDDRKDGRTHIEIPTHTRNQMGRCDYYNGPNNDIYLVKVR